jgi:indole-3-glycerol phosphate synthase
MFLDRIVADKRRKLKQRKDIVPLTELKAAIREKPQALDFGAALAGGDIRLIAEVKKASPSKGLLCSSFAPTKLAKTYAECGAAAISVLTESRYFQGSLGHLATVRRAAPGIPLLRKDFILEPYQVFESRARGADALLLIVSILSDTELEALLSLSHNLGMQCLVEVHDEGEVKRAVALGAGIIGINNRNLDTMTLNIDVTRRLRPLIAQGQIVVSESGIKERADIQKLREWGVNAVLMGEALVTATDIPAKIKELFDQD